jgi:hypothetical protein
MKKFGVVVFIILGSSAALSCMLLGSIAFLFPVYPTPETPDVRWFYLQYFVSLVVIPLCLFCSVGCAAVLNFNKSVRGSRWERLLKWGLYLSLAVAFPAFLWLLYLSH